jgi:hypothetical protein
VYTRRHLPSLLACTAIAGTLLTLAAPATAATVTWSVTPSPSPGDAGKLDAVSCTGPAFCMAAGSVNGSTGTLAETWNGRAWSVTPSPSPGGDPDELFGVSCTGPAFCMAAGWHYNSSARVYQTLAETWNGRAWTITPTASPSPQNVLFGVSCVSAARCTAVGYTDAGRGFQTLVETWNGRTWSVTASPADGTGGVLQAVSCRSAVSCQAVGWQQGTSGSVTLAESWNGSAWSTHASASPGSGSNELLGVSCTSPANCMAVGFYSVGTGPDRTLAQTWNGSTWTVATTPNRTPLADSLEAVSCAGSARCVAAGYYGNESAHGRTLIESWSGPKWSIVASPDPGVDNQLLGVACTAATSCRAAGYQGSGSLLSGATLVETGS